MASTIPETFTVEDARSKVYGLKGMGGEAIVETFRDAEGQQGKARQDRRRDHRRARIEWMKTLVRKPDGEMRPRLEAWENTASHLRRFVGCSAWQNTRERRHQARHRDPVQRHRRRKVRQTSVSNARHMRKAASGLFNWAAEAGRDYVDSQPLRQSAEARSGASRAPESDRGRNQDLLARSRPRTICPGTAGLGSHSSLNSVTMLRSRELLGAHRDELFDLDGDNPRFDVPLKRVKKRRVIQQPLSTLRAEIIREALSLKVSSSFSPALCRRPADLPQSDGDALRGTKDKDGQGRTKTPVSARCSASSHSRRTIAPDGGDTGR